MEAELAPQPQSEPDFFAEQKAKPAAAVLVKERPKFELREVPDLSPENAQQALVLASKLDITKPRQVLSFGEAVQNKVADFSQQLLENTKLADCGQVGELLTQLSSHVQDLDPKILTTEPKRLSGRLLAFIGIENPPEIGIEKKLYEMMGWNEPAEDRIEKMVTRHENIKPVLDDIGRNLGIEGEQVGISMQQLEEIEGNNRKYIESLGIVKCALITCYNDAITKFQEQQKEAAGSRDIARVEGVRENWDALQRMDRRLYAIEASMALAHSSDSQIGRLKEMLTYNVETINEARQIMLPAWRTKIGLAITALKAKDQAEMVAALRFLTDELLGGTADTLQSIEVLQGDMQKRTFASAEVIAKVNHQLALSIEGTVERQMEAKAARDAGIKMMKESQDHVIAAMKRADEAILGVGTAPVANILDTSSSPKTYDAAAVLLEDKSKPEPAAANG